MARVTPILVSLLIGCGVGFLIAHYTQKEAVLERIVTKVDTLVIRDTKIEIKPVPVTTKVIDTMFVEIHDTTERVVYLPREQKVYQNDAYKCAVSGYEPSLDWIEVYPETRIVTKEVKVKERKKRWGLGVMVGYGAVAPRHGGIQFAPYIGIGINYNFVTW